ncbi:response regulator transcription factor [Pontibacterium sp. N1Y112]|uniref:Response regulator transcription factor n=1 Tax=Pontibacterium sinense TaxID=2781979 RepID=A0A8J7FLL8_9GAMM|nr:response regulator [Pontibacterium sinense]MBE9398488.1 response regulator transcription factor [Pontibacterium sinense]MCO4757154.1 response regulator transcription factor [Oceanospirillaceae bacterium]
MQANVTGTIYIVDDDEDFRDSMQWLLESASHEVITFPSAQAFLDNFNGEIGCMLLDVRMPEINGLALQQIMQDRDIQMPIIVLSGHGDIPMAVSAMKHGALDFLEKPFDDEVLLRLVDKALKRADEMRHEQGELNEIQICHESLSRREKEVMNLVVTGKANREIAEELGISPKTVEVHRARVMSKMRASSLPVLVQQAARLTETA